MAQELTDQRPIFLSTLPATRHSRRVALLVVAVSAVIFAADAPFAKIPLGPVWAFIPAYESALAVNDLITAVLLLGQFGFLRSRALLVLASGYLFTTFITVAHALTFPGLFSPGGLLGADYEVANNRYRLKRIYTGESWNPQVQAPLAAPGPAHRGRQ